MLQPPEQKNRVVEKVPPYNFSLPEFEGQSVFKIDTIFGGKSVSGPPNKVSSQKPKHLSDIEMREPEYLVTCDLRELEREAVGNQP